MRPLSPRLSGYLLASHIAAYGLASVLHESGEEAFVGHDPDVLDMDPQVWTGASPERLLESVRRVARQCEEPVEADLEPGKSGNDRRPAIWARTTQIARARMALEARERLLDRLEARGERVPAAMVCALGTPAPWLEDRREKGERRFKPQRGASGFDGTLANHTSDFVRGVLRRSRRHAEDLSNAGFADLWKGDGMGHAAELQPNGETRTVWAPPAVRIPPAQQWLAAMGLLQFPVGLRTNEGARTPAHWREPRQRGVTLPVLSMPVSIPRLRALLQAPELAQAPPGVEADLSPASAARLRALGVSELVAFPVVDRSTPQSTAFFFGRGTRIEL